MPVIMSNPVSENRCGRFSIGEKFLEDEPFLVMKIMGRCLVVHCENKFMTNSIDYEAYSPEFEITENHSFPPFYNILINRTEEGDKIEFRKMNDDYKKDVLRKITY